MTSVLLSPHHDDETLFAAFTILREQPKVVIVLESHLQEQRGNSYRPLDRETIRSPIMDAIRQQETRRALGELILGEGHLVSEAEVEFWPFRDDRPDWDGIARRIAALDGHIYAPASTFGGHEHHNAIGEIVAEHIEYERRTFYTTYRRGTPDEREEGEEQVPFEPWMVAAKLRALACYRSQIELWPHHFLAEQREWYA